LQEIILLADCLCFPFSDAGFEGFNVLIVLSRLPVLAEIVVWLRGKLGSAAGAASLVNGKGFAREIASVAKGASPPELAWKMPRPRSLGERGRTRSGAGIIQYPYDIGGRLR
jgi:hypothetical protein